MARRKSESEHYQTEYIETRAYIPDRNGAALFQSTYDGAGAAITLRVYDLDELGTNLAASGTYTQTSAPEEYFQASATASWGLNDTGYNFSHVLGADGLTGESGGEAVLALMRGGRTYVLEYVLTPETANTTLGPIVLQHHVRILETHGVSQD